MLFVSDHAKDKCPMNTDCIKTFHLGLPSLTHPGAAPTNVRFTRLYLYLRATISNSVLDTKDSIGLINDAELGKQRHKAYIYLRKTAERDPSVVEK